MDLTSMRGYIRAHLEVDEEELPDTVLNVYLEDAYSRTLALDNRWPKQERTWDVAKLEGDDTLVLPPDCLIPSIMAVTDVSRGFRLAQINHETAEDMFSTVTGINTGVSLYYSVWARDLYLWPATATETELQLRIRGYAQPVWSNAASAVPDIDGTLHIPMCYYAMSLAYAAQEDEILEGVYLSRWDRDVRQQVKALLAPPHHRPLIMHGGYPVGGVPGYVIVPPES